MGRFEKERQKAIERVRARGGDVSKVCKSSSEFLDGLCDLFAESDPNESMDDIRKRLIEDGIDVDRMVEKVKALVAEKLEEYDEDIKKRKEEEDQAEE